MIEIEFFSINASIIITRWMDGLLLDGWTDYYSIESITTGVMLGVLD
jgi:hypothetical protein